LYHMKAIPEKRLAH